MRKQFTHVRLYNNDKFSVWTLFLLKQNLKHCIVTEAAAHRSDVIYQSEASTEYLTEST